MNKSTWQRSQWFDEDVTIQCQHWRDLIIAKQVNMIEQINWLCKRLVTVFTTSVMKKSNQILMHAFDMTSNMISFFEKSLTIQTLMRLLWDLIFERLD